MDTLPVGEQSVILAFGTAPPRRKLILWALFCILVIGLCSIALLAWFRLRYSYAIPQNTSVLIMATPKTISQIFSAQQQATWPESWRHAIQTNSSLPIILGAYREQNGWHSFALTHPSLLQPHKITLFADQPFPSKQYQFDSSSLWSVWRRPPFVNIAFWFHPNFAFVEPGPTPRFPGALESFTAYEKNGVIFSSISFQSSAEPLPLQKTDISLRSPLVESSELFFPLKDLTVGRWTLESLPPHYTLMNLNLNEAQKIKQASFIYTSPIGLEQAKNFLASLGFVNRRTVQLPDGSITTELALPDIKQLPFKAHASTDPTNMSVEISEREIHLGEIRENEAADNACPKGSVPFARLSPQGSRLVFEALGVAFTPSKSIQFASYKNSLVLCFE